ncbi:transmembrane and coiled-coil domain-containing protein 6 [Pseudophryne corroboree]|uniref:transmembrane and coiled-coil domain-containing protein 6 n=1 Tax=Pseudophryne corroboree TaxID=495146 RepID=UPI0030812A33
MWRRRKLGKQSRTGLEELRTQRRERETALRKARRQQQLISKRLLRDLTDDDDDEEEASLSGELERYVFSEQQVVQLIRDLQHGSATKLKSLIDLRHGLQRKDVQLMFIRTEGSVRVLIGLFTCQLANVQMEAARCLHELSHSDDPSVAKACLPATSYLLTYLSGSSADFTELCLYTLGNLIVESETARSQLLLQGLFPAFALCTQSPHVTVLEATGYALSQLLQAKEAAEKIVPIVLGTGLIQDILRLLLSDSEDGFGMMIEFAWCLHYIVSSKVNNLQLISQGVASKLTHLLIKQAELVTKSAFPGIELLICPVVRCVGNLLAEVNTGDKKVQIQDGRLLVALCVFMQHFHREHPFMVRECLWALNNLTVEDPIMSSAMLTLNLVPPLLQILDHSQDITVLVLAVLCNLADLGPAYCQSLQERGGFSPLPQLLGNLDAQVALRSLDLVSVISCHCPEVAETILIHSGLEISPVCKDPEIQQRVQAILNCCNNPMRRDDSSGCPSTE